MSNRSDPTDGAEHPSPYAPKWGRDAADPQQRSGPHTIQGRHHVANNVEGAEERNAVRIEDNIAWNGTGDPPARGDLYINHFRLPRSLDPGIAPEPWLARRPRNSRGAFGIYGRLILASSIAAGVALYFIAKSPRSSPLDGSAENSSFAPLFAGQTSGQATARAPQLVVTTGDAAPGAAPLPSAGTAGAGSPPAFSAMAPDARDDVETRAGAAAASALTSQATRELDPDAIATLLKHGEELIAAGDIGGARVLLRRAAEAHDAQAALTLAATYDPVALQKLGVRGVSADVVMARSWYEKAKEFGSAEGQARLELLASQHR